MHLHIRCNIRAQLPALHPPRMFSRENVGPLLWDSASDSPGDAIAAKNDEIRESTDRKLNWPRQKSILRIPRTKSRPATHFVTSSSLTKLISFPALLATVKRI